MAYSHCFQQWDERSDEEKARLKARQGLSVLSLAEVDVKDPSMMARVPHDGKTLGEIVLRRSSIMNGYLNNDEANCKAFKKGRFFTGDVGVVHADGYIEIKVRSKDVIISGGENISSVEVERVVYTHPEVTEAAVVAIPHPKWGESLCAFMALRKPATSNNSGYAVTEGDVIEYCRRKLPRFMVPKKVTFVAELPKTSTGKIQKFELRARAKAFNVVVPSTDQDFGHGEILALSSRL